MGSDCCVSRLFFDSRSTASGWSRAGELVLPTAALDVQISVEAVHPGRLDDASSLDGSQLGVGLGCAGSSSRQSTQSSTSVVCFDGSGAVCQPVSGQPGLELTARAVAAWTPPAHTCDGIGLVPGRPRFGSSCATCERRGRFLLHDAYLDAPSAALPVALDGREFLRTADDSASGRCCHRRRQPRATQADRARERPGVRRRGQPHRLRVAGLTAPSDLYLIEGRAPARPLTQVNSARLSEVRFGEAEQFAFDGAGGDKVYGYAVKPWNWQAGTRSPVALIVHGGPQSSMANTWAIAGIRRCSRAQALASCSSISTARPATARHSPTRLATTGAASRSRISRKGSPSPPNGSPGSTAAAPARSAAPMAATWSTGSRQLAGRFPLPRQPCRALRPLFDVLHDRGTVVPGMGPRRSVLRGSGEPRVVESRAIREGLEDADARDPRRARLPRPRHAGHRTFTACKAGHPGRLVYFPDENHWILKPANSLQWHAEVLGWLEKHLK